MIRKMSHFYLVEKKEKKYFIFLLCIFLIIFAKDEYGRSPLYNACAMNAPYQIIEFLLDHGCDPNCYNEITYRTCLHVSCMNSSSLDVVKLLIERKAKLDSYYSVIGSPFNCAASNENISLELLEFLISKKADVNITNENGRNALHFYCAKKNVKFDILKYMVQNNCDPNMKQENNITPIMYLCINQQIDDRCILFLMNNMDTINTRTVGGKTALFLASKNKFISEKTLEYMSLNSGYSYLFLEDDDFSYPIMFIHDNEKIGNNFIINMCRLQKELRERELNAVCNFLEMVCKGPRLSKELLLAITNLIPFTRIVNSKAFLYLCENPKVTREILESFLKVDRDAILREDETKNGPFYYAIKNRDMSKECFEMLLFSGASLGEQSQKTYFSYELFNTQKLQILSLSGRYEIIFHPSLKENIQMRTANKDALFLINAITKKFVWRMDNHHELPIDIQNSIQFFLLCIIKKKHKILSQKNLLYQIISFAYNFFPKKKFEKALNQHWKIKIE